MKIFLATVSLVLFVLGLGLINEFKPLDLADVVGASLVFVSGSLAVNC